MPVNHRLTEYDQKIVDGVSEHYGMSFVCLTQLQYGNILWYIFYSENPDHSKGHSNYASFRVVNRKLYVSNGLRSVEELNRCGVFGLKDNTTGEIVYSQDRHDFVTLGDYFIDGGRDYTHTDAVNTDTHSIVDLEIVDGVLREKT